MKIALFMPYFSADPNDVPVLYNLWLKTAAANPEIDFFVITNLAVEQRADYINIHYIFMTVEDFWTKLQSILNFPISHAYYKTSEYRVFFGIIFKDILRGYDYWGTADPDVVYGDILKFVSPYLERGADVIGRYGPFRLIKNTKELCNMPFFELKGMEHPLTLDVAFSNDYCWHFDEIMGMNVRYHQAGIEVWPLDKCIGDIDVNYKFLRCIGRGWYKWGFTWKDGKLIGYTADGKIDEFLCLHLQKRAMTIEGDIDTCNTFCILPDRIVCGCERSMDISPGSFFFMIRKRIRAISKLRHEQEKMSLEDKLIYQEDLKYCRDEGLVPHSEYNGILTSIWRAVKKLVIW